MAYRTCQLGHLVRSSPDEARARILDAIRRAGGLAVPRDGRGHRRGNLPASVGIAAGALGASRASLVLWMRRLGIGDPESLARALAGKKPASKKLSKKTFARRITIA